MTQIEKQQFRNNLHGWLGVVLIGPKGDDRGASVEPGGTVWLSEAEQILTANAPRNPADNPFIEQEWPRADPETGEVKMVRLTPLTVVDEGRFVPAQQRFIPGTAAVGAGGVAAAQAAAVADEPVVVVANEGSAASRGAEVVAGNLSPGHPAIPHAAARAAAAAEAERAFQEAAQDAAQGAVPTERGLMQPPAPPESPEPAGPPERPDDPATPSFNENTGDFAAPEESAAVVDQAVGEETGAAPPPSGEPPVGSYTAAEEVGTPDAVQPQPPQPPPFTPPEE